MDHKADTEYLNQLASGYQKSQVLFTAIRSDVFSHLKDWATAESVAEALGWSPRGARMLLEGLIALELVEKIGGQYRNGRIANDCLVPGGSDDQTHIMRHRAHGWDSWGRLDEAVRTGAAIPREEPQRSPEELKAFICGMADIARTSARAILEKIDLSPYNNLLDIGGGPGTYSIVFLSANKDMEATILDLEEVLLITRGEVEKAGLQDRVTFRAGDLTQDDFGSGFDLVLLSNIIHSHGPDMNADLVRRCYEAMAPGGLIIIKDFLVEPDRTGPPFSLLFALHMLLHTEAGDTYTIEDVEEWTGSAGFEDGRLVDLTPQTRLWLAEKPRG